MVVVSSHGLSDDSSEQLLIRRAHPNSGLENVLPEIAALTSCRVRPWSNPRIRYFVSGVEALSSNSNSCEIDCTIVSPDKTPSNLQISTPRRNKTRVGRP